MEPVLDETSLVPCPEWTPAARIIALSNVLKAFDSVGLPRALRSVSDAADRDIAQGRGLRTWCFERGPSREAGLFLASRLTQQPFIDGPDGLLAQAEGRRVLEAQVNSELVYGLGLAALEGRPIASLTSFTLPTSRWVQVQILDASVEPATTTELPVFVYVSGDEVAADTAKLYKIANAAISNGQALIDNLAVAFPYLRIGPRALESFAALSGKEPVFKQLIRHLRALNIAADKWVAGTQYRPEGITFSHESDQTLSHHRYGPIRDFPTPEGFEQERWSLHTKLTGGNGARIYFRVVRTTEIKCVLIGYFGPHLPCVRYPT